MTELRPTVGRQVLYMPPISGATEFDRFTLGRKRDDADAVGFQRFGGPYTATVVFVHDDGSVNLHVFWPEMVCGSSKTSEIVERVPWNADPGGARGHWLWPFRT